jgi:hypothetical protein
LAPFQRFGERDRRELKVAAILTNSGLGFGSTVVSPAPKPRRRRIVDGYLFTVLNWATVLPWGDGSTSEPS